MVGGQMSRKNGQDKWRKNNPEQDLKTRRKARKKYCENNKDKLHNRTRKYRQNMKPGAVCEIIKEHDIRHKDDPERLDIRKMMNIDCDA